MCESGGYANPGFVSRAACKLNHVGRKISNRIRNFLLPLRPRRAADRAQFRRRTLSADVFLHEMNQRHWHIDQHAVRELQREMLLGRVSFFHQFHATIPSDSVREMHDEISFTQLDKAINRPRLDFSPPLGLASNRRPSEQLMVAEHNDPLSHQPKSLVDPADAEHDTIDQSH